MPGKYRVVFGEHGKRLNEVIPAKYLADFRAASDEIKVHGIHAINEQNNTMAGNIAVMLDGQAGVVGVLKYGLRDSSVYVHYILVRSANPIEKGYRDKKRFFETYGSTIGTELIAQALKKHRLRRVSWNALRTAGEEFLKKLSSAGLIKDVTENMFEVRGTIRTVLCGKHQKARPIRKKPARPKRTPTRRI